MKIYFLFIFASAIFLVSCGSEEVITETIDVPALRASSIYHADSVIQYIELYKDSNKDLSEAYQKKSIEAQPNNLEKAVYYCKRAITLDPKLDLYNALGKLLIQTEQYEEAYELNQFITFKHHLGNTQEGHYIFTEPTEDMTYEYLVSCFLKEGRFSSYYMYEYEERGYDVKKLAERFLADDRLKIDTTLAAYKNFKLCFMSKEEIEAYRSSQQVFNDFLASIPDTMAMFDINAKQVQNFKYNNSYYDDEFEEMEESDLYVYFLQEKKEDANRWIRYNYTHAVSLNKGITAVVYAVDTSETACPKDMRHIYHRLVLYNEKGDIIDHKIIASQSGEDLTTTSFNQHEFSIHSFKRKWRNPYKKDDFDNDLLNIEETGVVHYTINEQGKIIESAIASEGASPAL